MDFKVAHLLLVLVFVFNMSDQVLLTFLLLHFETILALSYLVALQLMFILI